MATLTVYPGVKPDGTRVSVVAEDLSTPIPNGGAVVTYSEYYANLISDHQLLTENPVIGGPPPITILTAAVTVGGSPGAGKILKAISATQATWQDDAGGLNGVTVTGTPSAGQVLAATGESAATWQDDTAGVVADGDVSAEAAGAVFDDATESGPALLAALTAMTSKSGGRFIAPRTNRATIVNNRVVTFGGQFSNLHFLGGRYKRTQNGVSAIREGVFTFEGDAPGGISNPVNDVVFEHVTFQGNGAETDLSKAVQMSAGNRSAFIGVKLYDFAKEGLFWPGNSKYGKIALCHGERIGKWPGTPISVYNIATHYAVLFGSTAYDFGSGVEMGGRAAVIFGNIFEKGQRHGLMLHSTGGANELGAFFGNVIIDCNTGLTIADNGTSIGKSLLFGNVIYNCWKGVDIGSKPTSKQPYVVQSNFMLHGHAGVECIRTHVGGHVVQGNTIARITGTTTGAITAGTNQLTVPKTNALMHDIAARSTLTIAGVSGTKTVTAVSDDRGTITLDSNADVTVPAGTLVTFHSAKWVFVLLGTGNDHTIFRGNTIIGVPWSASCFRLDGTNYTLTENLFEPRGESYGSTAIIEWLDVAGVLAHRLLATDMDVTQPWTISGTMRSVIYAANAPPVGTWKVGDVRYVWPPVAGGPEKEICTTAGTAGTAPLTLTATTVAGTANVTLAGGAYAGEKIYRGCKIKIAGEYAGATVTVVSGTGANIVVDTNATVGVAGASVTYSAPVWKAAGSIAP